MITLETISYSLHSIQIKDAAGDALAIDASGNIGVHDAGGSLTVDGTVELGATTLAALENITVSGTVELGATTLAALESITVVATDLDIRDISHASDSIKIGDGTEFLAINADGSINAAFTEAGYDTWKVTAETVDTTSGGVQLVATSLVGRKRVEIQNLGGQDIYIKNATGVTTANGLKISKGSVYEQTLDENAEIWAITPSSTSDVRVAEYAA